MTAIRIRFFIFSFLAAILIPPAHLISHWKFLVIHSHRHMFAVSIIVYLIMYRFVWTSKTNISYILIRNLLIVVPHLKPWTYWFVWDHVHIDLYMWLGTLSNYINLYADSWINWNAFSECSFIFLQCIYDEYWKVLGPNRKRIPPNSEVNRSDYYLKCAIFMSGEYSVSGIEYSCIWRFKHLCICIILVCRQVSI